MNNTDGQIFGAFDIDTKEQLKTYLLNDFSVLCFPDYINTTN